MLKINEIKQILKKRLLKLSKTYMALKDYKLAIDDMLVKKNIYNQFEFNTLKVQERALLDAYLKRFSSIKFAEKYLS